MLAAVGTAGYTMLDDAGLRAWRVAVNREAGSVGGPVVYLLLLGISSTLWLAVLSLATSRGAPRPLKEVSVRHAALTGAGIYVTYALVLMSRKSVV